MQQLCRFGKTIFGYILIRGGLKRSFKAAKTFRFAYMSTFGKRLQRNSFLVMLLDIMKKNRHTLFQAAFRGRGLRQSSDAAEFQP